MSERFGVVRRFTALLEISEQEALFQNIDPRILADRLAAEVERLRSQPGSGYYRQEANA